MLTAERIAELATRLYRARQERSQIAHLAKEIPDLSVEDAYRIQRQWVGLEQAAGHAIRGYKVGLTTHALRQALQAAEPDFAPLLDDMFFATGHEIPATNFIAPRIEVELAFVLERPLCGPGVTLEEALRATAYVTPALEIIDARIEQLDRETRQPRKLVDVICDFAAAAGVVVGSGRFRPDALDLRSVHATLRRNDVVEAAGSGAAVLGHPAESVAWLANKVGGTGLQPGNVLLAGSFTKPVAIARGDAISADYGPLGAVSFRLS
jgi:2-oxo-hept-3-ene-1,7-dioate hydratase